jgi:preprotein translocase subunit SecF
MEFFKAHQKIHFMEIRRYTGIVSIILFVLSVGILCTKGLHLGLEFSGGTQIDVRFSRPVESAHIRNVLREKGFEGIRVQQHGTANEVIIRIAPSNKKEKLSQNEKTEQSEQHAYALKAALQTIDPNAEIQNIAFVGSEVGNQLIEQGGLAILVSILATMIYISLRFEYRLALSAALGLCHDAFLILGVFSLFGFEFDLATLASVLAVLSYSLNDTIVVFDRVRENFRKVRKGTPVEIMNLSINQTLSRTIMTSWMTLLVVLALLFFGGQALFGFSMAFFVGIIIGTFSSIYVSGALALWLGLSRKDLLPKVKVESDLP